MTYKNPLKEVFFVAILMMLTSCSSIPKNAKPVADFNVSRYLGTWYELARFDFRFEKNYRLRRDFIVQFACMCGIISSYAYYLHNSRLARSLMSFNTFLV